MGNPLHSLTCTLAHCTYFCMIDSQVIYDIILHHMCHDWGDVGLSSGPSLQHTHGGGGIMHT